MDSFAAKEKSGAHVEAKAHDLIRESGGRMTMGEALNRVRNERPVQATLSKPIPIPAAGTADGAIEVTNTGPIYGRDALEQNWADLKLHFSNHIITVDQYSPHIIGTAGNEVWMNGKYSLTVKGQNFGPVEQKGYLSSILVREGDACKTRMLTWDVTPEPAATSSPTTTPSNK